MDKLQLYNVSDRYINYLRKTEKKVYSSKEGQRSHMRKYLGVVFEIQGYKYYIPLSSPKESDYVEIAGRKEIRKSTLTIIRITADSESGEKELKGTLRISNMIPVPDEELKLYDVEKEQDSLYKDLIQKEIIFIRKNKKKIMKNAELVYKQKKEGKSTASYMNAILDFEKLEKLCNNYFE
jgi:protein AbiQ